MAKEDLIPMNERSQDEAKDFGKQGGIASGKARREKRLMKDMLLLLLASKNVPPKSKKRIAKIYDVEEKDVDHFMAIQAKQIDQAMRGNNKSYEHIRDGIGQMPVKKIGFDDEEKSPLEEMVETLFKQKKDKSE